MASRFGQTVPATRGTGIRTRRTGKVNSCMPMETSMRASGSMTKLMERALTHMPMALTITETGSMTSSTGGAWSRGPMVPSTKDSTRTARRTVPGSSHSLTVLFMRVSSRITKYPDKASTTGQMESSSRGSGSATRCMATGSSPGKTESAMRETS